MAVTLMVTTMDGLVKATPLNPVVEISDKDVPVSKVCLHQG